MSSQSVASRKLSDTERFGWPLLGFMMVTSSLAMAYIVYRNTDRGIFLQYTQAFGVPARMGWLLPALGYLSVAQTVAASVQAWRKRAMTWLLFGPMFFQIALRSRLDAREDAVLIAVLLLFGLAAWVASIVWYFIDARRKLDVGTAEAG